MLRGGADIRHVQQLLGHRSLTTTALYTRVDVSDLRRGDRAHAPAREVTARAIAAVDWAVLDASKPSANAPPGVVTWSAGPPHISIDSNGNLTQKVDGSTTWTYEWNAENQLTRVLSNGSEVARYKYDPNGRRVEKTAAGVTTAWLYEGDDSLRETSGEVVRFVHGPGVDAPLAREDASGTLTYFHADGLGSISKTTSATAAVTTTYSYDAFGAPTGVATGYAFAGREWDPHLQLYFNRARYYDPGIGRFLSEDPIKWLGGPNFYVYAGSRPTTEVDPFGLQSADLRSFYEKPPPPNSDRPPDYFQFNCSLWLASFAYSYTPGQGWVPTPGGNLPMSPKCACSATMNWIAGNPSPTEAYQFTTAWATTVSAFKGVGGQVTFSQTGQRSAGVGVGVGVSIDPGYGIDLPKCDACTRAMGTYKGLRPPE